MKEESHAIRHCVPDSQRGRKRKTAIFLVLLSLYVDEKWRPRRGRRTTLPLHSCTLIKSERGVTVFAISLPSRSSATAPREAGNTGLSTSACRPTRESGGETLMSEYETFEAYPFSPYTFYQRPTNPVIKQCVLFWQ